MATLLKTILSDTVAGLVAAVNTFLATKVAGSSVTILGFSLVLNDLDRYKGTQYSAMISYDDSGAAAQADPFILALFEAGNATDLETAVNDWYADRTSGSDFMTGVRNVTFAQNPSRLPTLTAWAVYSEDLADAGTNWALK